MRFPHCTKKLKLELAELFQQVHIEKGHLIITPQSYHRSLHFISEGIFRTYSADAIPPLTTQLHQPGDFLHQQGTYLNHPAPEYVQALSDAVLSSVDFPILERFLHKNPHAIKLLLGILERRLQSANTQNRLLHLPSATDRYQAAKYLLGPLLYQIPKHILSSYLAISLKHLGRIISQQLRK